MARDRLHAQLTGGIDHPVTTVTGPPGSGKTVLLSGWAQQGGPPVAWVAVDEADHEPADHELADHDPADHEPADHEPADHEPAGSEAARKGEARFWHRLTRAVRAVDGGLAERLELTRTRPEAMPSRPGRTQAEVPAPVASQGAAPIVLVVDDVQLLGPEAIRALGALIGDLPHRLRVILAGRHLSRLPVEEWRGRRQWGEIDPRDLRFTQDEAVALLASPGFGGPNPLPDDTARALADRSEGWAAGLRLAGLMFPVPTDASTAHDRFTGDAPLLVEYFNHELIASRPAPQVRFLLACSALELLTPEGCAAVTGRSDAGRLLETLCDEHVLLDRCDPTVPSYRYHPLFHEFLRGRLRIEAPAIARLSHHRVAAWCEAHGDDGGSIHHLIEAGSLDEAFTRGLAGVVGALKGRYLPGQALLAITELPDYFVDRDPIRTGVMAAARLASLRPGEAAGRLRALARHSPAHVDRTGLRVRAELLWAFRAGLLADAASVVDHFEQAVDLDRSGPGAGTSPEGGPTSGSEGVLQELDRLLWRHLRALAAAAHVSLGRPDSARAVLQDDAGLHDDADERSPLDDTDRLSVEGRLAYHEGGLQKAQLLAEAALAAGRRSARTGSLSTLDALRTLAAIRYEQNDLAGAAARLGEAQRLCSAASLAHWRAALAGDEACILVATGDASHALDLLRRLRTAEYDDRLPVLIRQRLDRVEIRCRLALGDLEGATHLAASLPAAAREVETLARLDLAAGRPDRAAERLMAGGKKPVLRTGIERLLLLSRACLQLGDEARGDSALHRAVEQGRADRFIRVFVDDGVELAGPLTKIFARSGDPYVSELLAHSSLRARRPGAAAVKVLEPFTERERQLLSYLPSHLSQHEIAGVMYISLNTVKTHTKAVYRKLGATCRSEAVDAARAHGLL
jgi:LuxR family maltose regulon positive regulatory protein